MIPRITFRNVAPFGKRAFINCPICGDLPERHYDRADAQIAWTAHEGTTHPGAGA